LHPFPLLWLYDWFAINPIQKAGRDRETLIIGLNVVGMGGKSMTRRAAGFGFIALSTLIYISRFISAAIYGSSQSTWNTELYRGLLDYVDQGLSVAAIVALLVGIVYLGWSELASRGQAD
jgi:hypothetical protein